MKPHQGTDRRAVQGDARADQGSRQVGAAEGRRFPLLDRVRGRRRIQEMVAQAGALPAMARRRADPRRSRRWPRATSISGSARSRAPGTGACSPTRSTTTAPSGSPRGSRISPPASMLPDEIPGTLSSLVWVAGDTGLIYSLANEQWRTDNARAALARQAARRRRRTLSRGRRGLPRLGSASRPTSSGSSSPPATTRPAKSGWSPPPIRSAAPMLVRPREKGVEYDVDER